MLSTGPPAGRDTDDWKSALRVISFDLDDTLWAIAPVIEAAERELAAHLQAHCPRAMLGHTAESLRKLREGIAKEIPDRAHDYTFLRMTSIERQLAAAGYAAESAAAAFEVFYAARNRVELFRGVEEVLTRLRERFELYALSNGNADPARCGIAHFFSGHMNARQAGALKPDPRIFRALVELAGVAPKEILHVGDDPVADVDGAARAGLRTAWLKGGPDHEFPPGLGAPDLIISDLSELELAMPSAPL